MQRSIVNFFLLLIVAASPAFAGSKTPSALSASMDRAQELLLDYYEDPLSVSAVGLVPSDLQASLDFPERAWVQHALNASGNPEPFPLIVGRLRARVQQAMTLEMAQAVNAGHSDDAKEWRAQLLLPRGVSASEGALVLQNLSSDQTQRSQAAAFLTRESLAWQTARVRQLLAAIDNAAFHPDTPLPGRLLEQLSEAVTLADVPLELCQEAGISRDSLLSSNDLSSRMASFTKIPWEQIAKPLAAFAGDIQTHLPTLISDAEQQRREKLLLKLVTIIPREYVNGVSNGQVTVALEYHEAVSFLQEVRQSADELAPLWLAKDSEHLRQPLQYLDQKLIEADTLIAEKRKPDEVGAKMAEIEQVLEQSFHITLNRGGTTAEIVDRVLLDTRDFLGQSLAAAHEGRWADASSLRLEAYTTYDPDLEGRLKPRDPQLATDIEHLFIDGLDKPGVQALLDKRDNGPDLEAAYARVYEGLDRAAVLLKSGISPTAAAINAASIVLREGLEGLLVIVAILAGLRGQEYKFKRQMIWFGVGLAFIATIGTVILSETLVTRLRYYTETIEAVSSILAIIVLLLITNWLFHQVYWRQWVCTLKSQAEGESAWQMVSVGFLIGYREGFEVALFLQSLMLDAGKTPVALGVGVGAVLLFIMGFLALVAGMKLPYFKLLLGTAALIGIVLITFVGTGVRSMQTVGWLPVHKLMAISWPTWTSQWLGINNTWETVGGQIATAVLVLGTWRYSRWQAKRTLAKRKEAALLRAQVLCDHTCDLDLDNPDQRCPAVPHAEPAKVLTPISVNGQPHATVPAPVAQEVRGIQAPAL